MRTLAFLFVLVLSATFVVGQVKVKERGGVSIVVDKSKPVRKGLEAWYEVNNDGFRRKDLKAIMALRTPDFHTLTPDGKTNDYRFMEERTRLFLDRIVNWISLKIEIGTIEVQGDLASAYMTQDTTRMQRLGDGTIHKVQSKAIQRETFRKTANGWKLYKVDDIKDQGTWVDGVQIKR